MVQFLSINFFPWISSIFVGFSKVPIFLCHSVDVSSSQMRPLATFFAQQMGSVSNG